MSPMNGRSTPLRSKMRRAEADLTCSRCGRTSSLRKAKDWNFTVKAGRIIGTLCSTCQTPEENAEAIINEATTTYAVDSFGRLIGTTKGGAR